jgi:maleate isomerase
MASQTETGSSILRVPHIPDQGLGAAARLGLILLSTDLVTEHAFRAIAPGGDIGWHVSRVANRNPTTMANLRAMADDLPAAAALLPADAPLGAIGYACTTGAVAIGEDVLCARIAAARPGVPCTTPIAGALAALDRLGLRSVALLTPYIDEVTGALADHLTAHGITVTAAGSFGIPSDTDMARVPPDDIYRAALSIDSPAAEAVLISCTALRSWPVIAPLERALGKPVVTSHQALLWHALRLSGCDRAIPGYGTVLVR